MANEVIANLEVQVSGKGIQIVQKDLKKTKQTMDETASSAKKGTKEVDKYGRGVKGAAGISSNASKNFSKMQQNIGGNDGSGGLVRAYALLAANVFALTAAFGVLQRSAQIDQLTISMEILSTRGGTSIDILSQKIKDASGGAIDLASAFRQVSLASSAGLSTAEIEGLTTVAKGAAISLGRDLPDAMDRIFRGAIKLEPEILDEIGLFVRVDEASRKYAESLGRTVSSLSQADKRQAFLNAILEQGTKKFEEYAEAVQPDAFTRLAAALKDIAQDVTSLLNSALGPLVGFLADSKGLLTTLFLAVAGTLLNQAIPALGKFTAASAENAQIALKEAQEYAKGVRIKANATIAENLKIEKSNLKRAQSDAAAAEAAVAGGPKFRSQGKASAKIRENLNKQGLTSAKRLEAVQARITELENSKNIKSKESLKLQKDELALLRQEEAALKRIKTTETEIRALKKGKVKVDPTSVAGRRESSLTDKALIAGSLSTVVGAAETQGIGEAFKTLGKETDNLRDKLSDKKGLGKAFRSLRIGSFALGGSLRILAVGFTGLLTTLAPFAIVAAAVAGVAFLLFKNFATGQKEAKKLGESTKELTTILSKVEERFEKQIKLSRDSEASYQQQVGAILAFTKQQNEVSNQVVKINKELQEFKEASNGAMKAWQGLLSIIGLDKESQAVEQIRKATEGLLESLIKAGSIDQANVLAKLIDPAGETGLSKNVKNLNEASKGLEQFTQEQIKSAEALLASGKIQQQVNKWEAAGGDGKALLNDYVKEATGLNEKEAATLIEFIKQRRSANAGIKNAEFETENLVAASVENARITSEQTKRLSSFTNAMSGAAEAVGKLQQSFLQTTKADEVLTSLKGIKESYEGLFKEIADGVTSISQEFKENFSKTFSKDENPIAQVFSPEEIAKLNGLILKNLEPKELKKEIAKIFDDVIEDFAEFQESAIQSKVTIAGLNQELKVFQQASSLGGQTGLDILKNTKDIAIENRTIAETNQKILGRSVGLEGTSLTNVLAVVEGKKESTELTKEELALFNNLSDVQKLALTNSVENVRQKEIEVEISDRILKKTQAGEIASKDNLVAQQKILDIRKKQLETQQASAVLDAQIAALNIGGDEQALRTLEIANAKERLSIEEEIIKNQAARQKVELEILAIRLQVLAEEQEEGSATQQRLLAIKDELTGTGGLVSKIESTLADALKNNAKTFVKSLGDDLSKARSGTFTGNISGILSAGSITTQSIDDEISKLDPATQQAQIDSLIRLREEVENLDSAYLTVTATMMQFANSMKSLGPEGAAAASILSGIVTITDGYKKMSEGIDENSTKMEKGAAVAEFATAALGAISQMMQANASAQIAELDRQIDQEKKRDGKSKESLARIAAMEKKKEAMSRKAFEQQKKMQMAQTVMATATAIMQTMATGGALALPLAIMIGAMGAMQLALIARQKYNGYTAPQDATPSNAELTIGKRSNAVDVSQSTTGGELNYLRGGGTTGTNLGGAGASFQGGAMGRRGYANGGDGVVVGERGPEIITPSVPVDITPNYALGGGNSNVNFTINAVDAAGVEDVLMNQRGNIIRMIREAANENGTMFLEEIDTQAYGSSK